MSTIKNFWENVDLWLIHANDEQKPKAQKAWKKIWTDKVNFNNSTVIDFGCGGGWLPELLFSEYNIKKYIGFDIAERCLQITDKVLKEKYDGKYELHLPGKDFSEFNPDVLVSQATIMHMIDMKTVADLLKNINTSNALTVVLHWRLGDKPKFNIPEEIKVRQKNITRANNLPLEFIVNSLSRYELTFNSLDEFENKNNTIYAIFSLKEEYVEHPNLTPDNELKHVEIDSNGPQSNENIVIGYEAGTEPTIGTFSVPINEEQETVEDPIVFVEPEEKIEAPEEEIPLTDLIFEPGEDLHEAGETKTGKPLFWYFDGDKLKRVTMDTAEKKRYRPALKIEL